MKFRELSPSCSRVKSRSTLTLTLTKSARTNHVTGSFTFSSAAGATFECRVDLGLDDVPVELHHAVDSAPRSPPIGQRISRG